MKKNTGRGDCDGQSLDPADTPLCHDLRRESMQAGTGKEAGIVPHGETGRLHHGWGLKRVQHVVERYNGSFACEVEAGRFVATAMLCMCDTS